LFLNEVLDQPFITFVTLSVENSSLVLRMSFVVVVVVVVVVAVVVVVYLRDIVARISFLSVSVILISATDCYDKS
jgi:hypothetical protein